MKTLFSVLLCTLLFSILGGAIGAHIYSEHKSNQVLGVQKKSLKKLPQQLQTITFEGLTVSIPENVRFDTLTYDEIRALILTTSRGKISLSVTEAQLSTIELLLICKNSCRQETWGNVTFAVDNEDKTATSAKGNQLLTISFRDIDKEFVKKTLATLSW